VSPDRVKQIIRKRTCWGKRVIGRIQKMVIRLSKGPRRTEKNALVKKKKEPGIGRKITETPKKRRGQETSPKKNEACREKKTAGNIP